MIKVSALPLSSLKITSSFGPRSLDGNSYHWGTDYYAIHGQPVYSVQSGVVRVVETTAKEYPASERGSENHIKSGWGRRVVIEHTECGFCSLYAHLANSNVRTGDIVKAGQQIGTADNTGHSYGDHLHIEFINANYDKAIFDNAQVRHKYNVNPAEFIARVEKALNGGNATSAYDSVNSGVNDRYADEVGEMVSVIEGTEHFTGKRLFGRRYRIIVYDEDRNGIDVSEMHIAFDCFKTYLRDPSVGTIKIYNLNADTENKLIEKATYVSIEAGYEDSFGLIFEGNVLQTTRYKEGATDYVTEIIVVDGDAIQASGWTIESVVKGTTKRQALNSISTQNDFKTTTSTVLSSAIDDKYIRGKVFFGNSYNAVHDLVSSVDGITYIDNGKVIYTSLSDYAEIGSDQIIQLDYDSGLLEVPSEQSQKISFKALLNPKIKLMSFVRIKNEYIKELTVSGIGETQSLRAIDQEEVDAISGRTSAWGVYKVLELEFVGNTRGDDWYVIATAGPQSGNYLTLLKNSASVVG